MTGRLAGLGRLPAGFEQLMLGQADQDRVERSGLQAGVAADVIPVTPFGGRYEEGVEHLDGLRRQSQSRGHKMKSTYIDLRLSTEKTREADLMDFVEVVDAVDEGHRAASYNCFTRT